MPTRSQRRRRERTVRKAAGRDPMILIRPRELIIAAVVAGGLFAAFLAFVLLRDGGESSPSATAVPSPLVATTPDEIAIEALGRQAVEALPKGEWPQLYDSFTPEFQSRCPRDQFVAAGEADAQEQGDALPRIRFVRMEDVVIQDPTAKGVIVGEITGEGEYRVRGAFEKLDGVWKLAPAAATSDCTSAFDRVQAPSP